MDEALNKKVRIFDIVQFEVMGYGVYNLFKYLFVGNHLLLIGMFSFLAVPVLFILYKNMWRCSPYQYSMMEVLQGALVIYAPAEKPFDKSIGLAVMLICSIIKYVHYCRTYYFDYEFKKEIVQNKILAYIWGVLAMFLYAGMIGKPGFLSLGIAIPTGLLVTWIMSHKNIEKETRKRERMMDKQEKHRQAEENAMHRRWEAEAMAHEAQQRAWQEERKYKENFRKNMGWDTDEQSDSRQDEYEKWFREQQSSSSSAVNEKSVFFHGCKSLVDIETRHRSLAKTYHPDSNAGDTETYQKIQEEYEILKEKFK